MSVESHGFGDWESLGFKKIRVLRGLADARSETEIAATEGVEYNTIRGHVEQLKDVFGHPRREGDGPLVEAPRAQLAPVVRAAGRAGRGRNGTDRRVKMVRFVGYERRPSGLASRGTRGRTLRHSKEEDILPHRTSIHERGRSRRLITQLVVVAGLLMPVIGLAAVELRGAAAATTYCTTSTPDSGSFGTVTYTSYIDAYADPACGGSRAQAYDVYSSASSVIWINMGQPRLWICGVGPYFGPDPVGNNVTSVNVWSGWTGSNSCGFQHDVQTYFERSGYGSDLTYTHL